MSATDPIYLDAAATTPVDERVIEAMLGCLGPGSAWANPSSDHEPGRRARALVDRARAQVAARIGATDGTIVFTSGATEANNLALKGVMELAGPGAHLVTTRIEHASVLDCARALQARGFGVSIVDCGPDGRVSPDAIVAAVQDNTALVSLMHVNNETGVIQDVDAVSRLCRERGIAFHTDAAQSLGKLPLEVSASGVDLVSLSAHKLHGPKGVGALYLREGRRLSRQQHGGEQEFGLRAGTLATHQIVAMGLACQLADPSSEAGRLRALTDRLWSGLAELGGVQLNGADSARAPHILNVAFAGVEGESLRLALADLAVSAGSACASDTPDASHVLSGMGLGDALAASSLRFSVSRMTDSGEIDRAIARVQFEVTRLRALVGLCAPGWCSARQIR